MRKLIETSQENEIVCDNPKCSFVIPNTNKSGTVDYINVPCPECGENLLTEEDYKQWVAFNKGITFINKWFSWLTIFIRKSAKQETLNVHAHNGLKITKG